MRIENIIEAILLYASEPIDEKKFIEFFGKKYNLKLKTKDIQTIIENLNHIYEITSRSFRVVRKKDGYYIKIKEDFAQDLKEFYKKVDKIELSKEALETLSIIIFEGPITKSRIDEIRGVNSERTLRNLLNLGYIKIVGKSQELGNPNLYYVSDKLLDILGYNSVDEIKDLLSSGDL